jgi:hypothetical protein
VRKHLREDAEALNRVDAGDESRWQRSERRGPPAPAGAQEGP